MTANSGLLQNRIAGLVVGLILTIVCIQSWLGMLRPATSAHSPVELFGLAFSILISVSIAVRTTFVWDRAVFAAVSTALGLATVAIAFSLTPFTFAVISVAKSLLWTSAAVIAVVTLVRHAVTKQVSN